MDFESIKNSKVVFESKKDCQMVFKSKDRQMDFEIKDSKMDFDLSTNMNDILQNVSHVSTILM